MSNIFNYFVYVFGKIKLILCLSAILTVSFLKADSYIYSFGTNFNGTQLSGNPPWVTATFTDVGTNIVQMVISTFPLNGGAGLTGSEKLDKVYFNFDPLANAANLNFSPVLPVGTSISTGTNAFKADGIGGYYDILINFPTGFYGNESYSYNITTNSGNLTASMFDYPSIGSSGPNSPYYAAAHIQAAASGPNSDWIAANSADLVAAPEPATYAILGSMIGLIALAKLKKARKSKVE